MQALPFPWQQHGNIIFSPGNGIVCQLSEPFPQDGLLRHKEAPLTESQQWDQAMANGDAILALIEENARLRSMLASHGISF